MKDENEVRMKKKQREEIWHIEEECHRKRKRASYERKAGNASGQGKVKEGVKSEYKDKTLDVTVNMVVVVVKRIGEM